MKKIFVLVLAGAVAIFVAIALRTRAGERAAAPGGSADPSAATATASASTSGADAKRSFPHAIRDPAKREELRARLLAAMAGAETERQTEKTAGKAGAAPARGNRQTDDIETFGSFVTQAINEDFLPMARECSKELRARQPDAGGSASVAFELLGDAKIGGVVNDAEVVPEKSTIHDRAFETCIRESLYGVYFDPPPAGGRATLRFDVDIADDGGVAPVDDFHLKDRRGETP